MPKRSEEPWDLASRRFGLFLEFLRRRSWLIAGMAFLSAAVAMSIFAFLLPQTHFASAYLAADDKGGKGNLPRLPESGYRALASSEEVLARLRAHPEASADLAPTRGLWVRLVDSRDVRRDGVARIFQLTVQSASPDTAVELANLWAKTLLEAEERRAREAQQRVDLRLLRDRRTRQELRVWEQKARLEVAEASAAELLGVRGEEVVADERLRLATEEALLQDLSREAEELRELIRARSKGGSSSAEAESVPKPSRGANLVARLGAVPIQGRLSLFLAAQPEPSARGRALMVRGVLAGLAGALLGLLLAGLRELSPR